MRNFFTILGGMGTLATESYVRQLNERTPVHSDQDYLNYVVVNHATVPDRTAFILNPENRADPRQALIEDIKQHEQLSPAFFVLTCNTAHYFYEDLQAVTDIPILHMPRQAAQVIKSDYLSQKENQKLKVAVLATEGTVEANVYGQELIDEKIEVIYPNEETQAMIMTLIYRDIKEQKFLNEELYLKILSNIFSKKQVDVAILGCTELSLMQEASGQTEFSVVDAQLEMVKESIRLGTKLKKETF